MRIACVDKSASQRLKLQQLIDHSYEDCRNSVNPSFLAQTYPASKDEVLLNTAPDVCIIGPAFSLEEAFLACRDIKSTFPEVSVFVFFTPESYSIRTLRRFERISDEIFSIDDPAIRIVHTISCVKNVKKTTDQGKLITVSGAKGGVGTTSITSGLAHACEALGKTAVVLDLSLYGSFIQYMSAQRWHSPDYAAALADGLVPDKALVERILTQAPNGINVFLPPSGNSEIRELWLRDPKRFEITITMIDILKEMFDVVLVDIANAEGVLPFAINARAHVRLTVSSNDPASIHLLNGILSGATEIPGEGRSQVLVNKLHEKGLSASDVSDFLSMGGNFEEDFALPTHIPFDARGRLWIGTGNSFYTESSSLVQEALEKVMNILLLDAEEAKDQVARETSLVGTIKRISLNPFKKRTKVEGQLKALPDIAAPADLAAAPDPSGKHSNHKPLKPSGFAPRSKEAPSVVYADFEPQASQENNSQDKAASSKTTEGATELYQAPTEVISTSKRV